MRFRGRVLRQRVARGSKSERTAVVLKTARRDYVLRRVGGHALRDPQLDALVGHTVEGEGVVTTSFSCRTGESSIDLERPLDYAAHRW